MVEPTYTTHRRPPSHPMTHPPSRLLSACLLLAGLLLMPACNTVNKVYKQDTGEMAEVPPPPPATPRNMATPDDEPVEFTDAAGETSGTAPAGANASANVGSPDAVIEPLPDPERNTPAPPQPAPMRVYVIKKGDSYWNIAKREYGDPIRMKDIEAANPDIDPKKLQIGDEILLPQ